MSNVIPFPTQPAPKPEPRPMRCRGFVGEKHAATERLDIREVAKLVRKDIRAGVKSGTLPKLKTSVRIERYSMGQSITVEVKRLPDGFSVLNVDRVLADAANPYEFSSLRILSEAAAGLVETLEAIVAQYNRDDSDAMSDYFDVRFYGKVRIADELRAADRARVLESVGEGS